MGDALLGFIFFVAVIAFVIWLIKRIAKGSKKPPAASKGPGKFPKILIPFAIAAIFGIILIAANGTPYLNCKSWIENGDLKFYTYAVMNIERYQIRYFLGIFLLVGSIVSSALILIFRAIKKDRPAVSEEITSNFD